VTRIALTRSAAFHPLATAVIRRFREAHHDIAIDLNERMVQGHVDAVILRKPIETPAELCFDLLNKENLMQAAGAGITLVPASMLRYNQECVVYRTVAGDELLTTTLHLIKRRDAANPAAVGFAQAVRAHTSTKLATR
jgi:DNA-binding transcriptional LysR family regulator